MENQEQSTRKKQKKLSQTTSHLSNGKLPPQAIELEEAVLGAVISDSYILTKIINFFKEEVFYKEAHQKIAKAILELYFASKPIDTLTVTAQVRKNEDIDIVGGSFYITSLTSKIISSNSTEYHLLLVYQKYLQREIIRICNNTSNEAFEDSTDVFELIEKHNLAIKILDITEYTNATSTMSGTIEDIFANMIQIETGERKNYYNMRPDSLNEKIMLSPGNIILLAGASGSGKTSIISEMGFSLVELNENVSIMWYSMEDMPENILSGQINSKTFLGTDKIAQRNCVLNVEEKQLVATISKELTKYDIEFIGRQTKIQTIRSGFNRFVEKRKAKYEGKPHLYVLIIDNILKLPDHQNFSYNKNQTSVDDYISSVISNIYDEHKEDSVIIMAHHFGKDQIDKKNISIAYRPTEVDLKGSEGYSRISTQVVLINRPGKHDDLIREYKGHRLQEYLKHVIIADVTKNRIIGKIGLSYFLANLNYKYFETI